MIMSKEDMTYGNTLAFSDTEALTEQFSCDFSMKDAELKSSLITKYKKEYEMKKITALIFALILTLGLVGCNGKKVNIDFPFEVEDIAC